MVHHLCVLSKNAVLVLDQRTLAIKYRLPVAEIEKISLSPYNDQLVIFHIKKVSSIWVWQPVHSRQQWILFDTILLHLLKFFLKFSTFILGLVRQVVSSQ